MLIINASINHRLIDTILIHNTGQYDEKGYMIYELVDKNNNRITETLIHHKKNLGYRKLLIEVLKVMEEEDIDCTPIFKGSVKNETNNLNNYIFNYYANRLRNIQTCSDESKQSESSI